MIRKAQNSDTQVIYQILQQYLLDIGQLGDFRYESTAQKQGAIVDNGDFSLVNIGKRVSESLIFNICEEKDKVVGMIDINHEIYFPEKADNIVWFDESLKENYFHSDKSIELHLIAVDSNHRNRGIATQLFEDALISLKTQGYTDIYSILMFGPITDCPSIIWHTKNGFSRACVTMPIDLFGIKNYQSLLMHRKINLS